MAKELIVTMEKVIRVTKRYPATQELEDRIMKDGENPFYDDMLDKIGETEERYLKTKDPGPETDVEYDYTIVDDSGKVLVDWD